MFNQIMKNFEQSLSLSAFDTNCRFTRDLGIELLKGTATQEHIETLYKSILGIRTFLMILEEKLDENKVK